MNGYVALALGLLILAGVWGFGRWRRPYRRHRPCKGTGRVGGSTSKVYGLCSCASKPPIPRVGAAAVAALVGEKYGKRYW